MKRVPIHLDTPLGQVPNEWLRYIEPYIERTSVKKGDHWIWVGPMRGRNQEPWITWTHPVTGRRTGRVVKRLVVDIFYHRPSDTAYKRVIVGHACGISNCLNPMHLDPRILGT